jgi:hypothetical protein
MGVRQLLEKAAVIAGCNPEMCDKLRDEYIRMYEMELADSDSVYQFVEGMDIYDRFNPFLDLTIKFGGDIDTAQYMVALMAVNQYAKYVSEGMPFDEELAASEATALVQRKVVDNTVLADIDDIMSIEEAASSGWNG